jgi:DNA modification methylase
MSVVAFRSTPLDRERTIIRTPPLARSTEARHSRPRSNYHQPPPSTVSERPRKVQEELSDYFQQGVPSEEPETTVLPEQPEFYRIPRRFGSIPVDELPLGCDRKIQYYGLYPRISLPFQRVERISFGHPECEPNRLFFGDNLHVMRMLPSHSVDLIYIDPPFFSGRQYNVIFGDQNEIRSFSDVWEGGMAGYLVWLNARLIEMKRLLKSTGAIYVHLDWHAVHYVKVELDKIFGYDNFLADVIWDKGFRGTEQKRNYQHSHDVILLYRKGEDYTWNDQFQPYQDPDMKRYNKRDEEGKQYALIKRRRTNGSVYYGKTYPNAEGKRINDIVHVPILAATAGERIGYPTQKPEALLETLIAASSNESDVVADFFCGGGTTPSVAQRLNRRWIAGDNSRIAVAVTADRLTKETTGDSAGTQLVQHKITPIPDISTEHWGIYEVRALTKLSDLAFRQFVIAAYNGRLASSDDAVHGYKDGVPLYVGPASQDKAVSKDEVLEFAETLLVKKGRGRGTMLAWTFSGSAVKAVEKLEAESSVNVELVKIALVQIESREFREHVVSKHKEYANLLSFILPPEIRIAQKRVAPRSYSFDISESASMNPGGRVMNVQWDFDFKDRFSSTKGYSFVRDERGVPALVVRYEFPTAGKWRIACKVQDDCGGEAMEAMEIVVS